MAKCFTIFDAIYKVADRLDSVRRIVHAVLDAYAAENTLYLELRCTLRDLEGRGVSGYLHAVLDAITEWERGRQRHGVGQRPECDPFPCGYPSSPMVVRVLVGVNRGAPVSVGQAAVGAAIASLGSHRCRWDVSCDSPFPRHTSSSLTAPRWIVDGSDRGPRVVGVDFSGNCYVGTFSAFREVLQCARNAGLLVTLHAGEKDDEVELDEMLNFRPDRVGHLVFATDETQRRVGETLNIPVEMNLTSNFLTSNWTLDDHHLHQWIERQRTAAGITRRMEAAEAAGHSTTANGTGNEGQQPLSGPITRRWQFSINTDDRGVFDTTLTHEYTLWLQALLVSDALASTAASGSVPPQVVGVDACAVILDTMLPAVGQVMLEQSAVVLSSLACASGVDVRCWLRSLFHACATPMGKSSSSC